MGEAWIIDAARTPRAMESRARALWEIHPQKLLSTVLSALVERNGLDTNDIDDVVMSCSSQVKNRLNVSPAWLHLMRAIRPVLQALLWIDFWRRDFAVNMGAASVMSGMEDLVVAGGVEMMSMLRPRVFQRPSMRTTWICATLIHRPKWVSLQTLLRPKRATQERSWIAFLP